MSDCSAAYRAKRAINPRFLSHLPGARARRPSKGSTCVCCLSVVDYLKLWLPGFEGRPGPPTLIAQRDPLLHMQERKSWNRAFSSTAIKEYEITLAKRVRQLVGCLEDLIEKSDEKASVVVDMTRWLQYFR